MHDLLLRHRDRNLHNLLHVLLLNALLRHDHGHLDLLLDNLLDLPLDNLWHLLDHLPDLDLWHLLDDLLDLNLGNLHDLLLRLAQHQLLGPHLRYLRRTLLLCGRAIDVNSLSHLLGGTHGCAVHCHRHAGFVAEHLRRNPLLHNATHHHVAARAHGYGRLHVRRHRHRLRSRPNGYRCRLRRGLHVHGLRGRHHRGDHAHGLLCLHRRRGHVHRLCCGDSRCDGGGRLVDHLLHSGRRDVHGVCGSDGRSRHHHDRLRCSVGGHWGCHPDDRLHRHLLHCDRLRRNPIGHRSTHRCHRRSHGRDRSAHGRDRCSHGRHGRAAHDRHGRATHDCDGRPPHDCDGRAAHDSHWGTCSIELLSSEDPIMVCIELREDIGTSHRLPGRSGHGYRVTAGVTPDLWSNRT
mmetsp:Transcript_139561/g.353886  ORF Transcript_139561/g.353886 Transcript_139561/m.353886 type:complete len:405 (+) Transcript_139561:640-1854(+)